jgi:hypothetical protein
MIAKTFVQTLTSEAVEARVGVGRSRCGSTVVPTRSAATASSCATARTR